MSASSARGKFHRRAQFHTIIILMRSDRNTPIHAPQVVYKQRSALAARGDARDPDRPAEPVSPGPRSIQPHQSGQTAAAFLPASRSEKARNAGVWAVARRKCKLTFNFENYAIPRCNVSTAWPRKAAFSSKFLHTPTPRV